MEKSPFKSFTVWFNVLSVVADLLLAMTHNAWVMEDPARLNYVVAAQAVVNLLLRFKTDTKVRF